MAWTPVNEDRDPATGRRFGFRISPWVTCDLLAVRGVRMQNAHLVAMVSLIYDGYEDVLTASLVTCERGDVAQNNDHEDDGA